jgi:sarcosine oxidase subunit beta
MTNVVLLEKGGLASGSTGDSAAIVRQHYSNEVSIRLVKRSVEILKNFPEELGVDVFDQIGWCFLVPPDAETSFFENMAQLQRLGIRTWEITVEEAVAEHVPGLNPDGIAHVAYEPDGGYADPHAMCGGFVDRAREAGAEVHINTPATGITMSGDRVTGVRTAQGEISADVVVNAAGPWAGEVGRWAGLDLPLEISREQEMMLRVPSGAPVPERSVSNMVDRIYFRPTREPGTVLVGVGHPKENEPASPDDYSRTADQDFIEDAGRRLARRMPHLANSEVTASWAGLYTITPDWSMIVDRAPGIEGMYLAVGGSGHSFKIAPAIGQCLAEMIATGKASTVDISPLRATRFDEGDELRSTYGGNRG